MNLIKWLRKNNTKIMAIVVVLLMFAFVGDVYITQLARSRGGVNQTVAYFGENGKITNQDRQLALREMEVLRLLRADVMLRSIGVPLFGRMPDMIPLLLGELLFSERGSSAESINIVKQTVRMGGYKISEKQINDIYTTSVSKDMYWMLLRNEAAQAGFRISDEQAGNTLAKAIPQMLKGVTYSQFIQTIINQQGASEKEILTTFGKLMAVLEYARAVCMTEDVADWQIRQAASYENETIDANFVRISADVFAAEQSEPTEGAMLEQFSRYKKFFAGDVNEENPYGFGYKLPGRVQLEYLVVRLDDVSAAVKPPTEEETEEYYQQHLKQFTVSVHSDPNDPNSPTTEKVKSYTEMAGIISRGLLQERINARAESILQEARALTEAGLEDAKAGEISAERRKQAAGDYKTAADQMTEKYKIKVYSGKTGLLSADDIRGDRHLGTMYLRGYGFNPIQLTQIVFSIDEIGTSILSPFDIPKPTMYENIGILRDAKEQEMAVVRVVDAQKSCEPESIDQTFSKNTFSFGQAAGQNAADVYSVRKKVREDLKKLAAMSTAKAKSKEFVSMAAKDGWESTSDKFNSLYGRQSDQNKGDPNAFKMESMKERRRISDEVLDILAVQSRDNPAAQFMVAEAKKNSLLMNQLYSLVPQDANTIGEVPVIMEFKPDMSYYCIKNLSIKRLTQQDYEKIKGWQVYEESTAESQSMAAVHFNPENIIKRMNFRMAEAKKGVKEGTGERVRPEDVVED